MPARKNVFQGQQTGPPADHPTRGRDDAEAALLQRGSDRFGPEPILRQAVAGMFVDADGNESVEAPAFAHDVAMVCLDQPTLPAQSMAAEAFAHIVVLSP